MEANNTRSKHCPNNSEPKTQTVVVASTFHIFDISAKIATQMVDMGKRCSNLKKHSPKLQSTSILVKKILIHEM